MKELATRSKADGILLCLGNHSLFKLFSITIHLMSDASIFTNMYSLLNPPRPLASWPISLNLPTLLLKEPQLDNQQSSHSISEFNHAYHVPARPKAAKAQVDRRYCSILPQIADLISQNDSDSNTPRRRKKAKKKAWLCRHHAKLHYAKGMCKTCYLQNYQMKRAEQELTYGFKPPLPTEVDV